MYASIHKHIHVHIHIRVLHSADLKYLRTSVDLEITHKGAASAEASSNVESSSGKTGAVASMYSGAGESRPQTSASLPAADVLRCVCKMYIICVSCLSVSMSVFVFVFVSVTTSLLLSLCLTLSRFMFVFTI